MERPMHLKKEIADMPLAFEPGPPAGRAHAAR
jgi:hypothetical protein